MSWEEARLEDSATAYHRFLRDNPKAPEVTEARERLALARLAKDPTAEGYVKFREEYPDSLLLAEIRPQLEEELFERARADGSREAYAAYLADFPSGVFSERALGNSQYLAEDGFVGRPADLAAFAERYPSSDFTVEAKRSGASLDARRASVLRRIGLVVEVEAGTPGVDRLQRAFAERAMRHYARRSVELVVLSGASDPRAREVDAILTIRHGEEQVQADYSVANPKTPGLLATTVLTLARPGDSSPIASEEFHLKVPLSALRGDKSILFGASGKRFWDDFYFPYSTWSTQNAARAPFPLSKPAVAVDAEAHRAAVLFEDGGFVVVDLSDPGNPRIAGRYARPRDLSKWKDLRIRGSRVAIFGDAGIEVVEIAAGKPHRVLALDRAKVGGVVAVEPVGSQFLVAGSYGILLMKPGSEPRRLVDKAVLGAAMHGDRLFFTDGESLFAASLQHLLKQKAEGQLRLGKSFGASRVRVVGDSAVLFGNTSVLVVDVTNPQQMAIRSRINAKTVGEIHDAIAVGDRVFVLGSRGLQVADAGSSRVADSVDVAARERLGAAGRHLVMVGKKTLQVVDTTPFAPRGRVAAPRP